MSINSLFFPNSYDLYCDELTCNSLNAGQSNISSNVTIDGNLTVNGTIQGEIVPGTITPGTNNQFLKTVGGNAQWETFTTSNIPAGSNGEVLTTVGSNVQWGPAGSGPQGPTGATGIQGPTGPVGPVGATGSFGTPLQGTAPNILYYDNLTNTVTYEADANPQPIALQEPFLPIPGSNVITAIASSDQSAIVACSQLPGTVNISADSVIQLNSDTFDYRLLNLPNTTQPDVLYYNVGSGAVSRGIVPVGATGPQGIQGIQGIQGPQGVQGQIGETGVTGLSPTLAAVSSGYCTWNNVTEPNFVSSTPQAVNGTPTLDPLSDASSWVTVSGGVQYIGTVTKNFVINVSGFLLPTQRGQQIIIAISKNGVIPADCVSNQYFSATDNQPHTVQTRLVIESVNPNDILRLCLGRSTTTTDITFTMNMSFLSSNQYFNLSNSFQSVFPSLTLAGPITSNGLQLSIPSGVFTNGSVLGSSLRGSSYGRYSAGTGSLLTLGILFRMGATDLFNRDFPNLSGVLVSSNGYFNIDFNIGLITATSPNFTFQCSVVVTLLDSKSDASIVSYSYATQVQTTVNMSVSTIVTPRFVVPNGMTLISAFTKAILE